MKHLGVRCNSPTMWCLTRHLSFRLNQRPYASSFPYFFHELLSISCLFADVAAPPLPRQPTWSVYPTAAVSSPLSWQPTRADSPDAGAASPLPRQPIRADPPPHHGTCLASAAAADRHRFPYHLLSRCGFHPCRSRHCGKPFCCPHTISRFHARLLARMRCFTQSFSRRATQPL